MFAKHSRHPHTLKRDCTGWGQPQTIQSPVYHGVSCHLIFGHNDPFYCKAFPSLALIIYLLLFMSKSPGHPLHLLEALSYCSTASREFIFPSSPPPGHLKLYIQLLNVIISLCAISPEEISLRTGFNSSLYPQYLLAKYLKQRCCFINVRLTELKTSARIHLQQLSHSIMHDKFLLMPSLYKK